MSQTKEKPRQIGNHRLSGSDITALQQLLVNIRPDWDSGVIVAVLLAHRDQVHAIDLEIAALRAAKNPNFLTPKAIGWRGPHWDHAKRKPGNPTEAYRCGICGKPEPRCLSDRIGDDDHPFEPTRTKVAIR